MTDQAYDVLGQANIDPVGSKFPDIQKEHVDSLGKSLCLVSRADFETQNHVPAISSQKSWWRAGWRREPAVGFGPGLVDGYAPDSLDNGVSNVRYP